MLELWFLLLAMVAAVAAWYHVLRLRERATGHARRLCERHCLQLLDDSVALHRLRFNWQHGALRVTREYRFETSLGGNDRRTASIILLGDRIMRASLPEPESREPATTASFRVSCGGPPPAQRPEADQGSTVVPISRARRTLH